MDTDMLVVGQGISGTWLSFFLEKAGVDYLVIDEGILDTPSRIASGMINPITGRRLVKTWMIDTLLPFAVNAYTELAEQLQCPTYREMVIVDFPSTPQMQQVYQERISEESPYLCNPTDETIWASQFRYAYGAKLIQPVLMIYLQSLLAGWNNTLQQKGRLRMQRFQMEQLTIEKDGIRYDDLRARKIIFCDGASTFNNPWFNLLPFAPNKGEALWIHTQGLSEKIIYKKGFTLVPLEADLYWVGSTYEWAFTESGPTVNFRKKMETQLKEWLKVPFEIIDHKAAIRPATLERRPFVGLHPTQPAIGILNGMGTKGCSLAPYFAHQLTEHLLSHKPIEKEADVQRFSRILQRFQ